MHYADRLGKRPLDGTRMRLLMFLLVFSAISIILSAIYGDGGYFQHVALCEYRDKLQDEIQVFEEQVVDLSRELEDLEDENFRVDKIAREEIGLSRPGEIIIYFDEDGFGERFGLSGRVD